jgi:hypothetical protein
MLSKKTTRPAAPEPAPVKAGRKKKNEATFEAARFQDEIQVQAYYNYLKRAKNNFPGSEESDWLEAERIVMSKMKAH